MKVVLGSDLTVDDLQAGGYIFVMLAGLLEDLMFFAL